MKSIYQIVPELEESRARCDELYADLLDTQEKLRMFQLQALSTAQHPHSQSHDEEREESQHGYDSKRMKIGEVLLQRDCQFVRDPLNDDMNKILR